MEQAPALLRAAADRVRQQQPPERATVTGTKVLEGPPVETIVREAAAWGAGLIVLESHGHTPVAQAFLGSVASGVAAHAACAVEIVRRGRQPVAIRTAG